MAKLAEYVAAANKQGSASGHSSATCFRSVKAFKVTLISRVTENLVTRLARLAGIPG